MTALLTPDEPAPYQVINPEGNSKLVLVCDHASNRLPLVLGNLGLNNKHLASHIAWDPGAASLARALSARLDAPLVMSNYSRLVIDCNRHPCTADSIPVSSHGIVIPGNADLSAEDVDLRQKMLFTPYQDAICRILESRSSQAVRVLSIHSFSPCIAADQRPWCIGVCYRLYAGWAMEWLTALRMRVAEPVGDNQPYRIEQEIDYTLPVQCEARKIPCIMLEIRQDKLLDQGAVFQWSELIGDSWVSIA